MSALLLFDAGSLAGCSDDETPIRLGLIAGISGDAGDLGQAGRNGAMLAVEQANAAGGIRGRRIELLIRDDESRDGRAEAVAEDLVKERVAAVVGPFSTPATQEVWPVADANKIIFFSTASSIQFDQRDDYLFRLCSSVAQNGEKYAEFAASRRGYRRVSLLLDATNPPYVSGYADPFKRRFVSLGGEVVAEVWHAFRSEDAYRATVEQVLEPRPDAVFIIGNAVHVARMAQQIANAAPGTRMMAADAAGTQELIELGGRAVDGLDVLQLFDRFGQEERFRHFVESYRSRFGTFPSSPSIQAYEIVLILVKALEVRKGSQDLKETVLSNGPYDGLQQQFTIDSFGDASRNSTFVAVSGDQFVPSP